MKRILVGMTPAVALFAGSSLVVSCQTAERTNATPGHETALEFSVQGMSCENCAEQATKVLKSGIPGAVEVSVDFDRKEARVRADRPVTRDQVRSALGTLGFEARFQAESAPDSAPLPEDVRANLDIRTVSHGDAFRVADHLARGKVTVFDYYAEWCGPCHLLTPKLERLLVKYQDLALRKVDIVSWESDAARQASREFKIPGLPFTRVFDETGKLLGQVQGNQLEKIEAIVKTHNAQRKQ